MRNCFAGWSCKTMRSNLHRRSISLLDPCEPNKPRNRIASGNMEGASGSNPNRIAGWGAITPNHCTTSLAGVSSWLKAPKNCIARHLAPLSSFCFATAGSNEQNHSNFALLFLCPGWPESPGQHLQRNNVPRLRNERSAMNSNTQNVRKTNER
jgi:hypothetical protein